MAVHTQPVEAQQNAPFGLRDLVARHTAGDLSSEDFLGLLSTLTVVPPSTTISPALNLAAASSVGVRDRASEIATTDHTCTVEKVSPASTLCEVDAATDGCDTSPAVCPPAISEASEAVAAETNSNSTRTAWMMTATDTAPSPAQVASPFGDFPQVLSAAEAKALLLHGGSHGGSVSGGSMVNTMDGRCVFCDIATAAAPIVETSLNTGHSSPVGRCLKRREEADPGHIDADWPSDLTLSPFPPAGQHVRTPSGPTEASPLPSGLPSWILHEASLSDAVPLPSLSRRSCSSLSSSFSIRNETWRAQRSKRIEAMRREISDQEIAECSFEPKIGRRRHRSATTSREAAGAGVCPSSSSTGSARETVHRGVPCHAMAATAVRRREEKAAPWLQHREDELMQECTFAPDLSLSASSLRLTKRVANLASSMSFSTSRDVGNTSRRTCGEQLSSFKVRDAEQAGDFVFTPQTNNVPTHMVHARSYMQKDVFSRLSEPAPTQAPTLGSPAGRLSARKAEERRDEMRSARATVSDTAVVTNRGGNGGPAAVANSGAAGVATMTLSSVDGLLESSFLDARLSAGDSVLHRFLRRQNECEEARHRRLQEIEASTTPALRPSLCQASRRLADRRHDSGTAGVRCVSTPSLQAAAAAAEAAATEAEECVFRPTINVKSARLPSRTCEERSRGDSLKREAHLADLRKQLQSKDEQEATFAPRLHTPPSYVEVKRPSILNADEYVKCALNRRNAELAKRELEIQRKNEPILSECTFRPRVNSGAPVFVQRMAETYRVARDLKEKENQALFATGQLVQQPRPDWR
eukprot:TRINITY_DN74928_c0_g1_i1.p1 TRINITY_DN74928_c0_g1~~TRINITY_DN74928_c0_g1_i1.p1  ORF type:complete len:811 (+),score=112.34 TRINITY_DN74928_c0_g1_i1:99-2531(+)